MTRKEYGNYLNAYPRKYVNRTLAYVERLEKEFLGQIKSPYPTIHNVGIKVWKGKFDFRFETENYDFTPQGRLFERFGFDRTLRIKNTNTEWVISRGAYEMAQHMNQRGTYASGSFREFKVDFRDGECFHRALIPWIVDMNHFFSSFSIRIADDILNFFCTRFGLEGDLIDVFGYGKYLFVDSLNPIHPTRFNAIVTALSYSIGFLTGHLPLDETYIVQSRNSSFVSVKGVWFQTLESSVKTTTTVIKLHPDRSKKPATLIGYVSTEVLSNFVGHSIKDAAFQRVLKIIAKANSYPIESRGALYAVALETMRNVVNIEGGKPFKSPRHSKIARGILTKVVELLPEGFFNERQPVVEVINGLNKTGNTKSFQMAFDHYKIGFDKRIIDHRNTFLHGKVPADINRPDELLADLEYVTLKFHFHLSALILKFCGYSGSIKNAVKFHRYLKDKIDEEYFISI